MLDPPPAEPASNPAARREHPLTPRGGRSFSDDTLEGLIDRSMEATLQAAADVKTLVDMLQLLLQRYRVQLLRLQNEMAAARAERSQIQREVERQREEAETAAWELHQQLEREANQARARLAEEIAALRAAAQEEARRIRLEAEREAAALLAAAQARRTELLAELQPWRRELEALRTRLLPEESAAPQPPGGAPRAPAVEPAASSAAGEASAPARAPTPVEGPPEPAPEAAGEATARPPAAPAAAAAAPVPGPPAPPGPSPAEPAAAPTLNEGRATAELVFLRVPDSRYAIALHAAIAALPGVSACNLREFERGRLVLDVEHTLGAALPDRVRALPDFDLRLTSARAGHIEFQAL